MVGSDVQINEDALSLLERVSSPVYQSLSNRFNLDGSVENFKSIFYLSNKTFPDFMDNLAEAGIGDYSYKANLEREHLYVISFYQGEITDDAEPIFKIETDPQEERENQRYQLYSPAKKDQLSKIIRQDSVYYNYRNENGGLKSDGRDHPETYCYKADDLEETSELIVILLCDFLQEDHRAQLFAHLVMKAAHDKGVEYQQVPSYVPQVGEDGLLGNRLEL